MAILKLRYLKRCKIKMLWVSKSCPWNCCDISDFDTCLMVIEYNRPSGMGHIITNAQIIPQRAQEWHVMV